ncbi:MAG TPA: hypothetical protein VFQ96_00300, partial [Microbacteriaceae bacterium]|nr:hypothetical protein [Microbacteriaceae bacterium]
MRFVVAIVTFVVAAALIGLGLAQRTLFAPDPHITASVQLHGQPHYVVIDGAVFGAHPGPQRVLLSGAGAADGFVAYGRTSDVVAWLSGEAYDRLQWGDTGELTARPVAAHRTVPGPAVSSPSAAAGDASAAGAAGAAGEARPDPAGSDLWLRSFSGPAARSVRLDVPRNVSVLIATDGTRPAPAAIQLSWPADTATPWTGPLVVAGLLLLLAGAIVYTLALRHLHRSRRPRRRGRGGGGKMPRLP